jgi:hypothetical protein
MNRDKILIEVYSDTFYRGYASTYKPDLVDEIISELIISLTSMDEDKLISIHDNKELKYYCIAIIRNMVINDKSNFNKDYGQFNSYEDDYFKSIESEVLIDASELEDELITDIFKFLKKRGENICGEWYNEELFKQCFKDGKNHREISKLTKIASSSVYSNIEATKKLIQTKFKDRYNDIRTH